MKKILSVLLSSLLLFSCADEKYIEPEMPPVPEYMPGASDVTFDFGSGMPVPMGELPKGVTYEVDGGNLVITNENTTKEYTFRLTGTAEGSVTYIGAYKCQIVLDGLNLVSTDGPALNIQCGKRIDMSLADGSDNSLTDGAGGEQKAALYCKGHLEVTGAGNLTIHGMSKHGIATKEYLQLRRSFTGTITVAAAAADAMHIGQYFKMNGGNVLFDANTKGDGIQVETVTLDGVTPDPEEEDNGKIFINGGNIEGTVIGEDCKGLKCDDLLQINGGTITLAAKGNGSRAIQTKSNMQVNELDAETPTQINITAQGKKCSEEDEHRCYGIKVEYNLLVTGGAVNVATPSASTTKARAIRVGTYTKTGGSVIGQVYTDD